MKPQKDQFICPRVDKDFNDSSNFKYPVYCQIMSYFCSENIVTVHITRELGATVSVMLKGRHPTKSVVLPESHTSMTHHRPAF